MCWLGRTGARWRGWIMRGVLMFYLLPISSIPLLVHLATMHHHRARFVCRTRHLLSQTLNPIQPIHLNTPTLNLHISAINLQASAHSSHPHREELWNERLGLKKRDLKDVVWRIVQGEQV